MTDGNFIFDSSHSSSMRRDCTTPSAKLEVVHGSTMPELVWNNEVNKIGIPQAAATVPPQMEYAEYTYEWNFDSNFLTGLCVRVVTPPCWFHRLLQKWVLGVYWRKI